MQKNLYPFLKKNIFSHTNFVPLLPNYHKSPFQSTLVSEAIMALEALDENIFTYSKAKKKVAELFIYNFQEHKINCITSNFIYLQKFLNIVQ